MAASEELLLIVLLTVTSVQALFSIDFHHKKPDIQPSSYDPFFYHHNKQTDFYGEFYYSGTSGKKIYTYCYDWRFHATHDCKPDKRHNYDHDWHWHQNQVTEKPYYRPDQGGYQDHHYHHHDHYFHHSDSGHDDKYHYFDGRRNIRVGNGRFYLRGRNLEVECEFPANNRLVSNIVWYRRSGRNRRHHSGNGLSRDRVEVRSLGRNGSLLIIRDYRSYEDDGVYRCFATRERKNPHYNYEYKEGKETIYVETEVYPRTNYGGGGNCGYDRCWN